MESALSGYLNTNLPLPCRSMHTLHSIRKKSFVQSSPKNPHKTLQGNSNNALNPLDPSRRGSHDLSSEANQRGSHDLSSEANRRRSHDLSSEADQRRSHDLSSEANQRRSHDLSSEANQSRSHDLSSEAKRDSKETDSIQTTSVPQAVESVGTNQCSIAQKDEDTDCATTESSTPAQAQSQETGTSFPDSDASSGMLSSKSLVNGHKVSQHVLDRPTTADSCVPKRRTSSSFVLYHSQLKCLIQWFYAKLLLTLHTLMYIVKQGSNPFSPKTPTELKREQEEVTPLSNALVSLGTEAAKIHCPQLWVTGEYTQLAVMALVGGAMERFLWKELHEVVYCEESWARALYHLRHTLWPAGKLDKTLRKQRSEEERAQLKKEAAEAFKKFLPGTTAVSQAFNMHTPSPSHIHSSLTHTHTHTHTHTLPLHITRAHTLLSPSPHTFTYSSLPITHARTHSSPPLHHTSTPCRLFPPHCRSG